MNVSKAVTDARTHRIDLERIDYRVQERFLKSGFLLSNVLAERRIDERTTDILLSFTYHSWGKKESHTDESSKESETAESLPAITYPSSWFEAVKERFLPKKWQTGRFAVRYSSIVPQYITKKTIHTTINTHNITKIAPQIPWDSHDGPRKVLQWFDSPLTVADWDEVRK